MSASTTLTLEGAMAHLAAIAGEEYARLRDDVIQVAPADAQQIAEILRFANDNGLAVMPAGSGTKLDWGGSVAPRIRLSLKRMNAVREHSWQDLTCSVEAGCSWAAMQAELARHGQMVALDPLWPQQATVGGIAAANDSGALRLKYGGLRDLIIGMTVVLADGTIAKTGGKVVKNVAGYDIHKLMTGSFGTLGVMADVNFRLHPIEERARTWSASAPDVRQLQEPLRALLDAQIVPSCVQLRAEKRECALDIRIAATPECLDEHAQHLRKIFSDIPLRDSDEAVWQARQGLFDKRAACVLKVSLLPAEICAVLAEMQQWTDMETAAVAQANGLTTVALDGAYDVLIARIEGLRARLRRSAGHVFVLGAPKEMRARLDVWACDSNALPLMREIKRRFDPNRILNPGRFVGNI